MITQSGTILTASHVLKYYDTFEVTLADGRSYKADRVYSESNSDLAIIKIRNPLNKTFRPMTFQGNQAHIGQNILAFARHQPATYSTRNGIILDTNISITNHDLVLTEGVIQSHIQAKKGFSGSPLCNRQGQVLGLNFAKDVASTYSIPLSTIEDFLVNWLRSSTLGGARLPFGIKTIDHKGQRALAVTELAPNSTAGKIGIYAGQIIDHLNDKKITNFMQFISEIMNMHEGELLSLKFKNDIDTYVFPIEGANPYKKFQAITGVEVQKLSAELKRNLNAPLNTGFIVSDPVEEQLFQRGDFIYEVNGRQLTSVKELMLALKDIKNEKEIVVDLIRPMGTEYSRYRIVVRNKRYQSVN